MKALVNKHNHQIRITAPEITIEDAPYNNHQYVYWIPAINQIYNPIDWTLVEEEENISWADRLKERLSKMSQEEIDKAFEEMGGDNDESPTLEEYLKAAYHSPIETEPVDLEKAAEKYADKHGFRVPYDGSNNFYDDVDVKASLEGFKAGAKWMAEQIKGGSK